MVSLSKMRGNDATGARREHSLARGNCARDYNVDWSSLWRVLIVFSRLCAVCVSHLLACNARVFSRDCGKTGNNVTQAGAPSSYIFPVSAPFAAAT